jgi:endoglucanase
MLKIAIVFAVSICLLSIRTYCADTDIRLNTIGFLPDKEKRASISAACSKFSVIRSSDSVAVFTGAVAGPKKNFDTDEDIFIADFSDITSEGTYFLKVDNVGRSPNFLIKKDVYNTIFYHCTRAMFLWRCGCPVSGAFNGHTYSHAACHLNDAYLDYITGSHSLKPSLRGWHDAGDYNKYTVNAGITLGMMFMAWEQFGPRIQMVKLDIPETGSKIPDFLAEIKWELDWLLTMQMEDGSVSHKVSTLDFCGFIMPETEKLVRYFVPWGSAATADFTAMMAMAGRIFHPYDSSFSDTCRNAAKKSYGFLSKDTSNHAADQTDFNTGAYGTTDKDDRLWAAAEMWETFGEAAYLADFEARAAVFAKKINIDWDWSNVKNLGMFTYMLSKKTGKRQVLADSIKNDLILTADTMVLRRNAHGYARSMDTTYYWGCNGSVARQAMVLQIANIVSPNKEYIGATLDAIGHLFGRNYYCRSFVTGLGKNPPLHPHDRRSIGDTIVDPWPGYLVGGGWPGAKGWIDADTNYKTNEIAINWQGALIYALAGFVDGTQNSIGFVPQKAAGAKQHLGRRVVAGFSKIKVPDGQVNFFNSSGKLVGNVKSGKTRYIEPETLGLGHGVLFMKEAITPIK